MAYTTTPTNLPKLAFSVAEAVASTPLSRSMIFKLIASGELRSVTVGARRLIPADALAELVGAA